MDGGTLRLKLLLGLIEQSLRATYLIADPQCHATAEEADIGVGVEGDDLIALVVIQDGIDGSGASVVGAYNDDLAHARSSPKGYTLHAV